MIVRKLCPSLAALAFTALCADYADAAPYGNGIRWAFSGTVTEVSVTSSLQPWCCDQVHWQVGTQVSGNIDQYWTSPQPSNSPSAYTGSVAFQKSGVGFFSVTKYGGVVPVDGAGAGAPDSFGFVADGGLDLNMGSAPLQVVANTELLLVDLDGTAWTAPLNPRAPLLLPDFAPDISNFETAEIVITHQVTPNIPDIGLPSGTLTLKVRIDSFAVPEPAALALESLALALLAAGVRARRPCNRRRPRAGRPCGT